jgi:hypothetical protein
MFLRARREAREYLLPFVRRMKWYLEYSMRATSFLRLAKIALAAQENGAIAGREETVLLTRCGDAHAFGVGMQGAIVEF